MKKYEAPWSTSLVVISALVSVVCLGTAITLAWMGHRDRTLPRFAPLPILIVGGSALFTIRGYGLSREALWVRRLCWTTRLPLTGLQSARVEPEAMRGSLRLAGNGGLFSFTGLFRNKALGTYRAFVTDPRRTVVLRFPGRTVVLSPSTPEELVQELGLLIK